ncbi:MAG: hypothetical protein Q8Q50_06055 [Methylobacter sp.]|nr:hypothetical protein [Methylobacter sp.]
MKYLCDYCRKPFYPYNYNSDGAAYRQHRYCSHACKQAAYRLRKKQLPVIRNA